MSQILAYHSSHMGSPDWASFLSKGVLSALLPIKRIWKILPPRNRIEAAFLVLMGISLSLFGVPGAKLIKSQLETYKNSRDFNLSKTLHSRLTSQDISIAFERLKSHAAYQYFISRKQMNDSDASTLFKNLKGTCAGQTTELFKKTQEYPSQTCLALVKSLNFVNICYFQMLNYLKVEIIELKEHLEAGVREISKLQSTPCGTINLKELYEIDNHEAAIRKELSEPRYVNYFKPAQQSLDPYSEEFADLLSSHPQNKPFRGYIEFLFKRNNMWYGHQLFFQWRDGRYSLFNPGVGLFETEHKNYFFELFRWSILHRGDEAVFRIVPCIDNSRSE